MPFDEDMIRKELDNLSAADAAKLVDLMRRYETIGFGNPAPARIDDYGEGLYRLRHIKPAYQGRLIFFTVDRIAGFERLIILAVYKKQSQKTPVAVIETAKRRRQQWLKKRG